METAIILIAAFRGIFHGIQTWLQYKDRKKTKKAQESAYEETLRADKTRVVAKKLISIVPERTMELLKKRVEKCYKKFNRMLENEDEFFEEDITGAARNALPACVCRNLGTIVDVAGEIPDEELKEAWGEYKCDKRLENFSL
jgi:hypothetical protein